MFFNSLQRYYVKCHLRLYLNLALEIIIDFTLFTQPKLLFLMYFRFMVTSAHLSLLFYTIVCDACHMSREGRNPIYFTMLSAGIGVFGPTPRKYNARFGNLKQSSGSV